MFPTGSPVGVLAVSMPPPMEAKCTTEDYPLEVVELHYYVRTLQTSPDGFRRPGCGRAGPLIRLTYTYDDDEWIRATTDPESSYDTRRSHLSLRSTRVSRTRR